MPRLKYATDNERMAAIREYRKNYGVANRQVLNDRSRQWRIEQKAARVQQEGNMVPVGAQ